MLDNKKNMKRYCARNANKANRPSKLKVYLLLVALVDSTSLLTKCRTTTKRRDYFRLHTMLSSTMLNKLFGSNFTKSFSQVRRDDKFAMKCREKFLIMKIPRNMLINRVNCSINLTRKQTSTYIHTRVNQIRNITVKASKRGLKYSLNGVGRAPKSGS